jgi:hypothetical protein
MLISEIMPPTPQRLSKPGARYEVVHGIQRVQDWPVARLRLGKHDHDHERRRDAAERLYAHYYHANMNPVGSRDYRQPFAGVTGAFPIMPANERQAYHRDAYRKARKTLGSDRIALATFLIVCEEHSVVEVGWQLCPDRQNVSQVRAVAIEMLIDGLDRLAPPNRRTRE